MIKNVVFDMGNVLILFYPEKIMRKYISDEDDLNDVLTLFYGSNEYREVDRGTLTYPEMLEGLKGKLKPHLIELLHRLYVENCFVKNEMPPFEEMYDVVKELNDNGYNTYLLSNATSDFHYYSQFIPAIGLLKGTVISADYKLLKPEREIYEVLFDKFSLEPSECVFIDDVRENVDGAISCGMEAICFSPSFENVSVLREKLRAMGIKI